MSTTYTQDGKRETQFVPRRLKAYCRCRWHRSQGLQLRNTCCRPVSRALMDDVLASVCHLAGRPLPRRLACGSLPASDSALEEQLRQGRGGAHGLGPGELQQGPPSYATRLAGVIIGKLAHPPTRFSGRRRPSRWWRSSVLQPPKASVTSMAAHAFNPLPPPPL